MEHALFNLRKCDCHCLNSIDNNCDIISLCSLSDQKLHQTGNLFECYGFSEIICGFSSRHSNESDRQNRKKSFSVSSFFKAKTVTSRRWWFCT